MPTTPALDGLPPWLQLLLTAIFGIGTVGVAFSGYRKPGGLKAKEEPPVTSAAITIADMGAVRRLSDVMITLDATMRSLERTVQDAVHHERNANDINREICHALKRIEGQLEAQARGISERDTRDDRRRTAR